MVLDDHNEIKSNRVVMIILSIKFMKKNHIEWSQTHNDYKHKVGWTLLDLTQFDINL